MKRALAFLMLCSTLGFVVLAQEVVPGFSGSWSFTMTYNYWKDWDPHVWYIETFGQTVLAGRPPGYVVIDSTVSLNYNVLNWSFGSETSFSGWLGYSSQKFTAVGCLGPVSVDAEMNFLPWAVTEKEIHYKWAQVPQDQWPPFSKLTDFTTTSWDLQTASCVTAEERELASMQDENVDYFWTGYWLVPHQTPVFKLEEITQKHGPAFKDLKVDSTLRLAGMDVGLLFYLNGWAGTTVKKDLFYWNGVTATQSGSFTMAGSDALGSGARILVSSELNGTKISSYTYFGLKADDMEDDPDTGCPVLGKDETSLSIVDACGFAFTEEYLMIEGLPFSCTTIDAALKIVCADTSTSCEVDPEVQTKSYCVTTTTYGFDYLKILVKDIPVIPSYNITLAVTFTTTDKSFAICGVPVSAGLPCLSLDLVYQWEEDDSHNSIKNKIGGLIIKKFSFNWELNECTKFFADAVLYQLYDPEDCNWTESKNALKAITSPFKETILVPAKLCGSTEAEDGLDIPSIDPETGEGYYEVYQIPKWVAYAWEDFGLTVCGPGCCGGNFEFSFTTYFGKKYHYLDIEKVCYCGHEEKGACCCDEYKCCEDRKIIPKAPKEEALGTLFDWMATDVSIKVPLFSSFTLTSSFEVSFRGWEYFDLGFEFTW